MAKCSLVACFAVRNYTIALSRGYVRAMVLSHIPSGKFSSFGYDLAPPDLALVLLRLGILHNLIGLTADNFCKLAHLGQAKSTVLWFR